MAYSWHKEYLDTMLQPALDACPVGLEELWEAVGPKHPEAHKKYLSASEKLDALFGDSTPEGMEEFKTAVKVKRDAILWAVEKYTELEAEKLPVAVKLHSKLLGKDVWLRLNTPLSPLPEDGIVVYTQAEVTELMKLGREGVPVIHRVKEIFEGSQVIEVNVGA
ncbi:MAG: hypothetical protein Q8J64_06450 [Thermodesulfovibrionales bacterium]|nr:hypothetical protein [Thermodesulfovibrionales bacterium]